MQWVNTLIGLGKHTNLHLQSKGCNGVWVGCKWTHMHPLAWRHHCSRQCADFSHPLLSVFKMLIILNAYKTYHVHDEIILCTCSYVRNGNLKSINFAHSRGESFNWDQLSAYLETGPTILFTLEVWFTNVWISRAGGTGPVDQAKTGPLIQRLVG